jgi:hypothetical protein
LPLILLLILPAGLRAQAEPEDRAPQSDTEAVDPEPPAGVQEVKPRVFYLRDQSGELVPVPEFSFERFEELLAETMKRPERQPPRYTHVDLVRITGKVEGRVAELEALYAVRLTHTSADDDRDWVRVPLRLNEAILVASPDYRGEGETILEYDKVGDGYVMWIRDAPGTTHQLTLTAKAPLNRANGDDRLALAVPRSPTIFRLEVAGQQLEGKLANSEGHTLSTQTVGDQQTAFTVDGTGGTIDLSWSERRIASPVLEATGLIRVAVDSNRIECDARLTVRSYGAPVDSFVVRLPPGMEWMSLYQPGFRFTKLDAEAGPMTASVGDRIRVEKLDGATTDPTEVRLVAWRQPDPNQSRSLIDVSGFEVLGATRQWGRVEFTVEGEWEFGWMAKENLRQIAVAPDASQPQSVAARFDYYRQPFSLQMDLATRAEQTRVEPTYVFYVEPDQVRMEAILRYKLTSAIAKDIQVDLEGWTVDEVTPAELVSDPAVLTEVAPLTLSLPTRTTSAGDDYEVRVKAHRELATRSGPLSIAPPRTRESIASPATIVVVPADSIELSAQTDAILGLIPDSLPSTLSVEGGLQPPLVYREEPAAKNVLFAGAIQPRARAVSVEITSDVRVNQSQFDIEQSFVYQISNESMQSMVVEGPRALLESGELHVSFDGVELPTSILAEQFQAEPDDRLHIAVDLPEPRIGRSVLSLRYTLPWEGPEANRAGACIVPLLQPHEDASIQVLKNRADVELAEDLAAELDDHRWVKEGGANSTTNRFSVATEGRQEELSLDVSLIPPQTKQSIVIHRSWLQTWLAGTDRRDRASYLLTSDDGRVEFRLPPYARSEGIEVLVAGEPTTNFVLSEASDFRLTQQQIVAVDLGPDSAGRRVAVELFYWYSATDPVLGRLSVHMPEVAEAERANRIYWQLVLPADEYLIWSPADLTRELVWRWREYVWQREGNQSQRDLEDWIGASHQQSLPLATNKLLFSGVGAMTPKMFITAKRAPVLMLISGCALAFGLTLIYWPTLRHPATLLVAGVLLGLLGTLYPDATVFVAQAAVLGICLVLLARLLEWTVARRRYQRAVIRGAAFTKPDSHTGDISIRQGEGSSRLGTTPPYHATAVEP